VRSSKFSVAAALSSCKRPRLQEKPRARQRGGCREQQQKIGLCSWQYLHHSNRQEAIPKPSKRLREDVVRALFTAFSKTVPRNNMLAGALTRWTMVTSPNPAADSTHEATAATLLCLEPLLVELVVDQKVA